MKKIICFISLILVLLLSSFTVLAGSIPEDLLHSDDAQIFFAEVIYYYPDKENPKIEVSPTEVIKGDVKTGVKLEYLNPNTVGDFKVKEGNVYLFTYFDEHNPTDMFEVENNDVSGIKLKNITGDMWERFEEYLNDGRYFEAEQERRQRLGLPLLIDNPIAMRGVPILKTPINRTMFYILLFAVIILTAAFKVGFVVKKKRN